jgi:hypothetical protein
VYPDFSVEYIKNIIRANDRACKATFAFQRVQLDRHNITQVNESIQKTINLEVIQAINPMPVSMICAGKAVFISFCTPEREVKVLVPV